VKVKLNVINLISLISLINSINLMTDDLTKNGVIRVRSARNKFY